MKNKFKYFYLKHLKVMVYCITKDDLLESKNLNFKEKITVINTKKTKYELFDGTILVHESTVHKKLFFLKLIDKIGPAIGDCYTNPNYRGQSIYPDMISKIAKNLLLDPNNQYVFMIVNQNNESSKHGIIKAGFKQYAKIETFRFLFFYLKIKITF